MSDCKAAGSNDSNPNDETTGVNASKANSLKANAVNAKTITDKEFFYGHKAYAGCGGSIAVRLIMKVLGERTFAVVPAGCISAVGFMYPQLCFANNALISTFAGTASMMSGVAAGAKALGLKDFQVVGISGDGGTARRICSRSLPPTASIMQPRPAWAISRIS